jgi:hypothetical protein
MSFHRKGQSVYTKFWYDVLVSARHMRDGMSANKRIFLKISSGIDCSTSSMVSVKIGAMKSSAAAGLGREAVQSHCDCK